MLRQFLIILICISGGLISAQEQGAFLNPEGSKIEFDQAVLDYYVPPTEFDLSSFLAGLSFKPEHYSLDLNMFRADVKRAIFKYQPEKSRLYLLAGPQYSQSVNKYGQKLHDLGLSMGLGVNVTKHTNFEANFNHSIFNTNRAGQNNAFIPIDFRRLNLGFNIEF